MSSSRIFYTDGWKYRLERRYEVLVSIHPTVSISTQFISLSTLGLLTIEPFYSWDGPSGPTIDTKNFMRGSLVHDALCQLMREGHLDHDKWQEPSDKELVRLTKEDGMWAIRRAWVYWGARLGDGGSAENERPILTAP